MKYTITYGLYEEPEGEFERECNSLEELHIFLSVMEGLISWMHIYDEKGVEYEY